MRIATVTLQQTMRSSMERAQNALAKTNERLATEKRANDMAELGTDGVRTLSARSMLSAQEAQGKVARELGTKLSLYDANITTIDTAASELRTTLVTAVGNGNTAGVQQAVENAFAQYRAALNATSDGKSLFAGGQVETKPFLPETLTDTVGATTDTAFAGDGTRASTRVADNVDVTYGVTASEIGSDMLAAFRTIAEAGTIGAKPTEDQLTALRTAIGLIDDALPQVRAVNAANGERQQQVETLAIRADDRSLLLTAIISDVEDADYGQLSIDVKLQQQYLEASYSVFAQITEMSLTDYL
ncbi:MAG TPA: flagellin [Sphingomonas sp.]|jgi:flagellar hook-associated protein 3 FlgL|nr:flagellin [Sphingomonas sp.]